MAFCSQARVAVSQMPTSQMRKGAARITPKVSKCAKDEKRPIA